MKIVNRETFLAMPAGVLFSKYQPCYFGALTIKGDSLPTNDFCYQQIADAVECRSSDDFDYTLQVAEETGESFSMDFNCEGRDGCFEGEEMLFAIWEPVDVQALITRLTCLLPPDQSGIKST